METSPGVSTPHAPPRWDLLESEPPTGERLIARVALPGRHPAVLIALDAAKRRHILVELPDSQIGAIAERTSRGIAVQTVELNQGSGAVNRFVEISCLDDQGHAALDIVVLDLVNALEDSASTGRVELVQNVLAKWRRFWSGVAQEVLSKEQQLGLFGELWFLNKWLAPTLGIRRSLEMWRGPGGARNDFESADMAVEVKTTGRLDGAHVINGLDQLLEPPGGRLMLFSLIARDEASGAESLPAQVREARDLVSDDYALQSQLDALIYAAGYDDRLASEYGKLTLRVRNAGLYKVTEGFPRLIPASLAGGVPVGVSAISYELRLDGAAEWLLAATPAAAAKHLSRDGP